VASEWILGVARARVPYLGYTRLITTGEAEVSDLVGTAVASGASDPNAESTCVLKTDGRRLSRTATEAERAGCPDLRTASPLAGSRTTSATTPTVAA
jgi:hypothetical protein